MGTWGIGLYFDDLAADLRGAFRDYIGEGLSATAAVDRLMSEYASSLTDVDEAPVFWLALADTAWKLGRLDDRVRQNALQIIDSGRGLERWDEPRDRRKREQVLAKLRAQLLQPQPPPKHVRKPSKSATEWEVGEIIAFQLKSGRLTLMRVIGRHVDKGGCASVCELLDWVGSSVPSPEEISRLPLRSVLQSKVRLWRLKIPAASQFLFQEPKKKADKVRVMRTGIRSVPAQQPAGYGVFVWPYVDKQFFDKFGLE